MKNTLANKQVLVTGGAGFVGHHLVRNLLSLGCRVRIIDDLSTGREENILKPAEFQRGDIRSAQDMDKAARGCDVIFHLAARVELQKSIVDPMDCFSVNVEGTACVVKAALRHRVRRLIFASSCSLYPLHHAGKLSENMATIGETPYALSKRVGEQTLEIFSRIEKLSACSLRCFNIYGPGQRADSPYSAAIPKFIAQAMRGDPITIFGTGEQTRDFVHVEDVVQAYLLAAQSDALGVYNVAAGKSVSVAELASMIQSVEEKSRIQHLPAKPGDASFSEANIAKISKVLKYKPKQKLSVALKKLYQHSLQNTLVKK